MDEHTENIKQALIARNRTRGRSGVDINDRRIVNDLMESNAIAPEKVAAFIADATSGGRSLADQVLVEQLCTVDELVGVLGRVYDMEPINLDGVVVDHDLAHKIDGPRARQMGAVPISLADDEIPIVAISNPESTAARDNLPRLLGSPSVHLRLASHSAIEETIARVYEHGAFDPETSSDYGLEVVDEDIIVSEAETSPAAKLVNALLAQAQRVGASDLHLQPGKDRVRVRMRVDAMLDDVRELQKPVHEQLVRRIKHIGGMQTFEEHTPQDGRTTLHIPGIPPLDVRIATMPTVFGEKVTLRLMDATMNELTIPELGMSEANLVLFRRAVAYTQGAIIVTGPTGAGKSTTLYAVLRELNSPERSIITVEDPVEQKIAGIDQVQVKSEQGLTFATMLRSILRNDPDTIMVGELRDPEPAQIAMEAANTGHLVLATMHANTSLMAISRLSELGVENFRIATQLKAVTAQRLARKLCTCRLEAPRDRSYLASMHVPEDLAEEIMAGEHLLYSASPDGCARCHKRGYSGRIGLHEVLPITKQIQKQIIKDPQDIDALRVLAEQAGYRSLYQDGIEKVFQGLTSLEELSRAIDEE